MANVLELAKAHAFKAAEADPARAAAVEEKKRWMDAKAGEIYAVIQPLASQFVMYQGKECRIQVSRRTDRAELCIMEREQYQAKDGEIRTRDSFKQLAKAMGCGVAAGYLWQMAGGPPKQFAQIDDLVAHVAAEIGPMLLVERE